ncbi:Clp protease ClpP [Streptomyces roseoverticillatus]|uniref:head maturation protease, ClpP-related n=1 Tax=Streptomyces roseoverticillatus TaxID=66429 RepID=UPI001F32D80A|nr:head maturation protease, ClpP-related [Streptomyces roseoverticillatus]MCF3101432.1 Clp protease ClpP [Streptomyces roseoverticillatus]
MPERDHLKTARPRAALRQGRNDWYRIKNLADGATEIAIYDEIGYWGVTASDFIAELKTVNSSEITLRLNSPGGEVFDGIAIMNALRSHSARVTTHVDGIAASIASVIAMAGDRIVMQPHSQMMIHDGSGLCIGNAADMREMADLLDKQSDNIAAIYAERAGGTVKQWRTKMLAETWYSAQEAVEAGLADEVAKPQRRPEPGDGEDVPMAAAWDLSVFRYAGRTEAPAPTVAVVTNNSAEHGRASDESGQDEAGNGHADEPGPEPEAFAFDPAVFRAALDAAADPMPHYDPGHLRSLMAGVASDAPAEPPRPQPVSPEAAAPAPPVAIAPATSPGDAAVDYFRALMANVANSAPAPPEPATPDPAPAEPVPSIDRQLFERALWEARL